MVCSNTCSTPTLAAYGDNNFTNDPLFVNRDGGDFRLLLVSPCVNAGWNMDWMTGVDDAAGMSRIDRVFGVVDLGAYEQIPAITRVTAQ